MKFVKVTVDNGNEVAIDASKVLYISPTASGSVVYFDTLLTKPGGETALKALRLRTSIDEFVKRVG